MIDSSELYKIHQDLTEEEIVQNIMKEIEMLSEFLHPLFCQLYGFCKDQELIFVSELCELSFMSCILTRSPSREEVLKWLYQIIDGISIMHSKNVIHRDIKPANILITASGDAKITDLGLASNVSFNTSAQTSLMTSKSPWQHC